MSRTPKPLTRSEEAYIRDLRRRPAFDLLDEQRAEVLSPEDYPEPLKRFLARERVTVHVRLSRASKRRLEARSRETGIPIEEPARTWIEQGMA